MKQNKVIQIIDSLDAGGAEVLAINIANTLVDENYSSHLCTTRREGVLKNQLSKDVAYVFLNKKSALDFKAVKKLKNYINKNYITVIHAHNTSYFISFLIKLLLPSIKVVWHNHTGAYIKLKRGKLLLLKFVSNFFSGILTVNKELKEWSIQKLKTAKVIYLPNYCKFLSTKKQTFLKGIPEKRIIYLAALREEKDHLNALKAFYKVIKNHKDWTLHFVGKSHNNKYSKSIENYINTYNLSNSVFLYDVCLDIKHILSQSSIGIISSKNEGLPIALLEYGLAKLPVITTDVGECRNLVTNNVEGFVIRSKKVKELEKALIMLISNPEKRREFANNFNQKVTSLYTEKVFFEKLKSIYNQL